MLNHRHGSTATELPEPSIDICIVTYNSSKTLPDLLASLDRIPVGIDWGLFVHDNSGDVELMSLVNDFAKRHDKRCLTEVCHCNCGFAAGCNALANSSGSEYLLFLNPDAHIVSWPEGWPLARGVWGPEIWDARGRRARLYGRRRGFWHEIAGLLQVPRRPPEGIGYVSGACLLIDRESFIALGGFDSSYFMYFEDVALCTRAFQAGLPVKVREDWQVAHIGGASSPSEAGRRRSALVSAQSFMRFHRSETRCWRLLGVVMSVYLALRSLASLFRGRSGVSESQRATAAEYLRLARGTDASQESRPR
jgi:GT2 family glycosyltransferase